MPIVSLSKFIGWLGFCFGVFISIPQIIKIIKTKSIDGISRTTYVLLLCTCVCYTVRSLVIKEYIFIASNIFQIIITLIVLYLMKKYEKKETTN